MILTLSWNGSKDLNNLYIKTYMKLNLMMGNLIESVQIKPIAKSQRNNVKLRSLQLHIR